MQDSFKGERNVSLNVMNCRNLPKVILAVSTLLVCWYIFGKYSARHDNEPVIEMNNNDRNLIDSRMPDNARNHQLTFTKMTIKQYQEQGFDFRKATADLSSKNVSMSDRRLIELIRNYWIENPSTGPYNLDKDMTDYSMGQAPIVDNRLDFKENGFFIECGALDGETRSNSLFFERKRQWNGLLVEADPSNYAKLKKKNRRAFTINACLSPVARPVILKFRQSFNQGRLAGDNQGGKTVDVQCFPLYSILLALGVKKVDYFSLDVEGEEISVLQTIPFDKLDIRMMTVEYEHGKGGDLTLKSTVERYGYNTLLKIQHYNKLANDLIFKKN